MTAFQTPPPLRARRRRVVWNGTGDYLACSVKAEGRDLCGRVLIGEILYVPLVDRYRATRYLLKDYSAQTRVFRDPKKARRWIEILTRS